MSVVIELRCVNYSAPLTDECFSLIDKGVFAHAEDSQKSVASAYKLALDFAFNRGWVEAPKVNGRTGMICPNCAKLLEAQSSS
ncbi:hypothetical protein LCGC14_0170470 [marine sediment metagenome]|jgi:hypothetical protein|uniref:Uncharacterized protein n=1 Tax=marine sediment metagenome TaxID=412755 RepID=A0A0F9XUT3_9ZZZZ|nr:hypothetical protein [Oceanospirillaceae bacterium]|tara:strand:- start:6 stop:254 length:249 start_codon:yes stop_codon:yes gene_type:complete